MMENTNMEESKIREIIKEELSRFIKSDRFLYGKHIQLLDGRNIQLGKTTGTKIGTATDQKLGFYGATPIVKQTGVAVSSAGIHAALVNLGLIT